METLKTLEIQNGEPIHPIFNARPLEMILKRAEDAVREKGVANVESALLYISWQVLPEVQNKYPEVAHSAWYHVLIGGTPDARHQGCDEDAQAYEETRRLFTELPQRIERGDFDDILSGFLARQKITGILSVGRI